MAHLTPGCAFVESGIIARLGEENWSSIDELCGQLYADRKGWGINGKKPGG